MGRVIQPIHRPIIGGSGTILYSNYILPHNMVEGFQYPGYMDFAAGNAFVYIRHLDMSEFRGIGKITLIDTNGKSAVGYIGTTIPAGPTFGANTYTSDFSADVDGWAIGSGTLDGNIDGIFGQDNCLRMTCNDVATGHFCLKATILTAGRPYRFSAMTYIPSGQSNVDVFRLGNDVVYWDIITTNDAWVTSSGIMTADSVSVRLRQYDGTTQSFADAGNDDVTYIKNVVIDPVSDPPTTGAHIVSAPGGSTRNWTNIESGFLYRTIYTVTITRI